MMKINLLLNGGDVRAGHLNVDPFATPGDGKVRGDVADLSGLVHDGEAVEIVALDVVDYIGPGQIDDTVAHWVAKLRHGGRLTIGGLDLREVCRLLSSGQIDEDGANALIYGRQDAAWQSRKESIPLRLLCSVLEAHGLEVLSKSYDDCFYRVTARRP